VLRVGGRVKFSDALGLASSGEKPV
jgi:hypothetical protein